MHIEELNEVEGELLEFGVEKELVADVQRKEIVVSNSKRIFILIGARALFYPTLLYNVIRNKIQSEFRWWDAIDQFILLGAVPFPTDVPCLKQLGVHGVITLNEPYETLVPTSLYHAYGIDHLVIPTRDYLFAPSFGDICRAVNFIHKNASSGKTTYVHCKAGRGRSTTIVLCYLVQYRQMTPDAAFKYVKSIRSRVLLASSQWKAVKEFYYSLHVIKSDSCSNLNNHLIPKIPGPTGSIQELAIFDDSSVVVVKESDLEGYDGNSRECGIMGNDIWAEVSLIYRVQFASQAALARLSCLRLGFLARQNVLVEKLSRESSSCSVDAADQLGGLDVDIHVYC